MGRETSRAKKVKNVRDHPSLKMMVKTSTLKKEKIMMMNTMTLKTNLPEVVTKKMKISLVTSIMKNSPREMTNLLEVVMTKKNSISTVKNSISKVKTTMRNPLRTVTNLLRTVNMTMKEIMTMKETMKTGKTSTKKMVKAKTAKKTMKTKKTSETGKTGRIT